MSSAVAPVGRVLEYYLVVYRRTWRSTVLSSFVLPLLIVVGFGYGVGGYIDSDVNGVSYLEFLVPGVLAMTVANVAIFEGSWPVYSNFTWYATYKVEAASPLRVRDILAGHLGYALLRVLASWAAFLLVAVAFGALPSLWALVTLPLAVLLGLAVAGPTFAFSASVPSDSFLILLFRFGVVPMSLFSGVYFPIESLPVGIRALAYVLPLWHGVDLFRAACLGAAPQWSLVGHLLVLGAWAAGGVALANYRFTRKLLV